MALRWETAALEEERAALPAKGGALEEAGRALEDHTWALEGCAAAVVQREKSCVETVKIKFISHCLYLKYECVDTIMSDSIHTD